TSLSDSTAVALACASVMLFRPLFRKNPLGRSQFRAAGPRIRFHLSLLRKHRLSGEDLKFGYPPTLAHRPFRRARTPPGFIDEVTLDDPVLQRVKTDDDQPSTGSKPVCGRIEDLSKRAQFVVDSNAQSLKGPFGGMRPAAPRSSGDRSL